MNKKVLAAAVAGAFIAPAAFAQSQVQIYGAINLEFSRVDPGSTNTGSTDSAFRVQNPGGSAVGVRGTERLFGSTNAWFQCETQVQADDGGVAARGLCDRNSGVGLQGGWGRLTLGQWDTPFKTAASGVIPFQTTGATGIGALLYNGTGGGNNTGNRASFSRRQSNTVMYNSPSWSGFSFNASYGTGEEAHSGAAATPTYDPDLWAVSLRYANGPLIASFAYERHNDYNVGAAAASGTSGTSDDAWQLALAYKFAGKYNIGFVYNRISYEPLTGMSTDRNGWGLYADLEVSGPHSVRIGYTRAGSTGGNFAGAIAGGSGLAANAGAGNTGASQWSLAYAYAASKRTEFQVHYSRINNDALSTYNIFGSGTGTVAISAGADPSVFGVGIYHRF